MKNLFKRLRCKTRSWLAERRMDRKTRMLLTAWIQKKGYLKNQTMLEASEDIGVSLFQLRYYFSKLEKKPFLIWRKEMRIKAAVEIIMKDPDKKLEAVALEVGIFDLRNFRRQFEETMKTSLSNWRKSLRKNK